MIEALGYIAGFLFAFCAAPQAVHSWRLGHSRGLSPLFLWLWTLGEVFSVVYVWAKHGFDGPLMLNYFLNIAFLCVIIGKELDEPL